MDSKIGKGAFGVIHTAKCKKTGAVVAVKLVYSSHIPRAQEIRIP